MSERHTISVNDRVYYCLRNLGIFGESFNDILERILKTFPNSTTEENENIPND
jgi:hypothetical protein